MACIRKRRGKWVVDYRDGGGRRRVKTCVSQEEANRTLGDKLRQTGVTQEDITLEEYARDWLARIEPSLRSNTIRCYRNNLNTHIIPALGKIHLSKLTRPVIRLFLIQKLGSELKRLTIRTIIKTLHLLLNEAVEDNYITVNPASRIGRKLKLGSEGSEEIKAMTREQLASFLSCVEFHPFFLLLARTGMRVGEAAALDIKDVNFEDDIICVSKNYDFRQRIITGTKTGKTREVDMSNQLSQVLRGMLAERRERYFKLGIPMPTLLFPYVGDSRLIYSSIVRTMRRGLKKAGLPNHFTPHCLRHTFASLLLQQGENVNYVQRMLGHASISVTADLYGKWLPVGNKAAVDRLDEVMV